MRNSSRRWRKAMWKAVNCAAGNGESGIWKNDVHPIWGMRAIRHFERINGIAFDPLNDCHLVHIAWMGRSLIYIDYMKRITEAMSGLARTAPRGNTRG